MQSDHPLPDDVVDALRRGRKIEAIKLLRDARGLGLKEAKDAVENVESAGSGIYPSTSLRSTSSNMSKEVEAALQQGNRLEAIRLFREQSGANLKDAKEAVDAAAGQTQAGPGDLAPGEVRPFGSLKWIVAAACVAGWLVYYFFQPG